MGTWKPIGKAWKSGNANTKNSMQWLSNLKPFTENILTEKGNGLSNRQV
jgi:hypothetical protein